ncbi:GNAT family N-acetyltransferase [Tissierella sp.]|uniref:GNAT family N-acetyltransferase n=1 Tax=Tissierella sp. TaxID=41274 RepID=UPI0028647DBC|nr:GNAT family N-acetyltransferase [Tissierella sp.]MDR7857870.1 GNAT family N-acetyltransferase [Tissierella sp.]
MIKVRELTQDDMKEAIELKILCWTEELAGRAENTLFLSQELEFWVDWMLTAKEHNDIRLLIGAFEDDNMLGVAFASFADTYDIPEKGIELNGLWVYPDHRSKGASLMMISYILNFFLDKGMEKIVIYNHHYSTSNQFYRKFGGQVVKQEYQMDGKLLVDVFIVDAKFMKRNIEQSLERYL